MSVIDKTPPGLNEDGSLINDVVKAREEKRAGEAQTKTKEKEK